MYIANTFQYCVLPILFSIMCTADSLFTVPSARRSVLPVVLAQVALTSTEGPRQGVPALGLLMQALMITGRETGTKGLNSAGKMSVESNRPILANRRVLNLLLDNNIHDHIHYHLNHANRRVLNLKEQRNFLCGSYCWCSKLI